MKRLLMLGLITFCGCLAPLDFEGAKCDDTHACPAPLTCVLAQARCRLAPDGSVDAGRGDAGLDAGTVDAGQLDAGPVDAGFDAGFDAGEPGMPDAGPVEDAGVDAGSDPFDAGFDAGVMDAGVDVRLPLSGVVSIAIYQAGGSGHLVVATDAGALQEFSLSDAGLSQVSMRAVAATRLQSCGEPNGTQTLLVSGTQLRAYTSIQDLSPISFGAAIDGTCVDFNSLASHDAVGITASGVVQAFPVSGTSAGTAIDPTNVLSSPVARVFAVREVSTPNCNGGPACAIIWASFPAENKTQWLRVRPSFIELGTSLTGQRLIGMGTLLGYQDVVLLDGPVYGLHFIEGVTQMDIGQLATDGGFQPSAGLDAGVVSSVAFTEGAAWVGFTQPADLALINAEGVLGVAVRNRVGSMYENTVEGTVWLHQGAATALAYGDLDGDAKGELVIATPTGLVLLRGR